MIQFKYVNKSKSLKFRHEYMCLSLNPLTLLQDAADFRAVRFEYKLGFDSNPTVLALAATFRVIEIAVLNQF